MLQQEINISTIVKYPYDDNKKERIRTSVHMEAITKGKMAIDWEWYTEMGEKQKKTYLFINLEKLEE